MYKLKKISGIGDIKEYLLVALFFFVPLFPKLASACIIGYAILSFLDLKKENVLLLWQRKELLFFGLVYLILVIGLSYTIDLGTGISKIQTQLSFIVFPLFFVGAFQEKSNRNSFFQYFNWGLVVAILICLINALRRLFVGDSMYVVDAFSEKHNVFLYQEFSGILDLHPSYFALYLGLAIFYLLFFSKTKDKIRTLLRWAMLILFFSALFLTSSKAGIFSFMSIALGFQVYRSMRRRNASDLLILVVLIGGFVLMFATNPLIYNRSVQAFKSVDNYILDEEAVNESTSKRFGLWHVSLKQIEKKSILGYGTGSTNQVLNDSCIHFFSFSICEGLRHKNTHNQYLNLLVSNGLLILIPFLLGLFFALQRAIRNKDGLYFLFTLFLIINCFFESLLERERGVVFFMLFMVLLSTTSTRIKFKNEHH